MRVSPNRDELILKPGLTNSLVDVPGIKVGHFTHDTVHRGVTVILTEGGATAGVSVRGSNPGTFNTDALNPTATGGVVHGISLTGGSLFGLGASTGVTEWLYDKGVGFRYRNALIPVISGAVIYDLTFADPSIHPTPDWGRMASDAASTEPFSRGNVGVGAGATAGKGPGCVPTKGGLGTASLQLPGGIVVAAVVVINALGGLVHPNTGELYARGGGFDVPLLYHQPDREPDVEASPSNTTLGVVATNARLTGSQATKVADLVNDGLARAIRPMHATLDGDSVFALSVHEGAIDLPGTTTNNLTDLIGHAAADAMVLAVLDAAEQTKGVEDWPSVAEAQAKLRRA